MWWQDKSRKSRVLGLVKDMTKSEARKLVDAIVTALNEKQDANRMWSFREFVDEVYIPFYCRKWKASTKITNMNRVQVHLVSELGTQVLSEIKRDDLQKILDQKGRPFRSPWLIICDGM
jgi:hypothetical protein